MAFNNTHTQSHNRTVWLRYTLGCQPAAGLAAQPSEDELKGFHCDKPEQWVSFIPLLLHS